MSELDDRRQRAREAFYDVMGAGDIVESRAVEAVIETATRVQITPEIMRAAQRESPIGFETPSGIAAAFRAAGFEVVG